MQRRAVESAHHIAHRRPLVVMVPNWILNAPEGREKTRVGVELDKPMGQLQRGPHAVFRSVGDPGRVPPGSACEKDGWDRPFPHVVDVRRDGELADDVEDVLRLDVNLRRIEKLDYRVRNKGPKPKPRAF